MSRRDDGAGGCGFQPAEAILDTTIAEAIAMSEIIFISDLLE